jgi:hypothetical protein
MTVNLLEINDRKHNDTPVKSLIIVKEDDEMDNEDRETADKPSISNLGDDGQHKP